MEVQGDSIVNALRFFTDWGRVSPWIGSVDVSLSPCSNPVSNVIRPGPGNRTLARNQGSWEAPRGTSQVSIGMEKVDFGRHQTVSWSAFRFP